MTPSGQIESSAAPARNKPSPKMITAVLLAVLIVLFAVVNSQTVTIHWIVTTSQTPLIVVIAGCGFVGFAVGWTFARRRASRAASR
ncbi:MAG TPA: LapA family protein [Solirubrobacteraceae bacterium]|jgi:uncharacterized integral membrane protein